MLVPVAPDHADALQRLVVSDPDIVAQTRLPAPYPPDGAARWVAYAVARHAAGEELSFAVTGPDGAPVGACGLVLSDDRREAELGYWIGRPFRGQGHATAAVRAALAVAFETAGLDRVVALPLATNAASRRVLEKSGLRFVWLQPAGDRWPGLPAALYEIERSEWR